MKAATRRKAQAFKASSKAWCFRAFVLVCVCGFVGSFVPPASLPVGPPCACSSSTFVRNTILMYSSTCVCVDVQVCVSRVCACVSRVCVCVSCMCVCVSRVCVCVWVMRVRAGVRAVCIRVSGEEVAGRWGGGCFCVVGVQARVSM